MSSVNSLIKSKVGRRFFLLFLITAFVPVVILAFITYQQVSNQIYLQTKKSLYKESKAIGMAVHQRINFLETEIGIQLQKRDSIEQLITYKFNDELGKQLKRKFKNLTWFDSQGNSKSISGNFEKDLVVKITKKLPNTNEFFQLMEYVDEFDRIHFFAVGIFTADNNKKMYLLGEIEPDYLWRTDTMSEDESTCIFNASFKMLYCSKLNGDGFVDAYKLHSSKSKRGLFEWSKDNESYISNTWEIFLGDHELVENWTIILSKSKQSVFRTVDSFRNIFSIVMLLVLILIILISVKQIRNVLIPLQLLKDGATRLTNKDFTREIHLDVDDEFAELANSFNLMSGELSRKFRDLKVASDIDNIILTSTDSNSMRHKVLTLIADRVDADIIGLLVLDEFTGKANFKTFSRSPENDTEVNLKLTVEEKEEYASHKNGIVLNAKFSNFQTSKYLDDLGMNTLFIFPIFIDDSLSAVCVISYKGERLFDKEAFDKSKVWVEKIGMALTKSAWQEKLYHQAHYDSLTNLPNRTALKDFLHNAIYRAAQYNASIAVLFIDLDRFKIINDSLGHLVGDEFLKIISNRITKCLTSTDMVSRFGGDEFTIVLTDLGEGDEINHAVNKTAFKILESISKSVVLNGREMFSTCSIGVVMYPDDATGIEDLLKNADSAMYHAKNMGGNTLQFYSESMNVAIQQRLKIETDLRNAIEDDQLEIYFQPQIEVSTMNLIGAEALVRWNHPTMGLVSPIEFIPIAEKSNLICDVDIWVLNKTIEQIKSWEDKKLITGKISVNFSAKLIQKDDVVGIVWKIINKHKVNASKLLIEITESALIQSFEKTIGNMHALIKLGISFAIDDFGTGYSSLSYLKHLPVEKLKIDQAFIFNLITEKADASIVKSTIALSRDLGITSLAEGVETEIHLQMLKEMGCDQIQGYLISKPIAAAEYCEMFLSTKNVSESLV